MDWKVHMLLPLPLLLFVYENKYILVAHWWLRWCKWQCSYLCIIHTYIMQNWQSDGVIKWNKVAKISLQPPWWKIIILKFILLHECASECMIYYDAHRMYCRLHAQTLFMNQIHEWKLFSHWHSKKKCARKNQLAIEIMRQIK